jgi:hypothetical protein
MLFCSRATGVSSEVFFVCENFSVEVAGGSPSLAGFGGVRSGVDMTLSSIDEEEEGVPSGALIVMRFLPFVGEEGSARKESGKEK